MCRVNPRAPAPARCTSCRRTNRRWAPVRRHCRPMLHVHRIWPCIPMADRVRCVRHWQSAMASIRPTSCAVPGLTNCCSCWQAVTCRRVMRLSTPSMVFWFTRLSFGPTGRYRSWCPSAISRLMLTPFLRRSRRGPEWFFWPTPTIQPALMSASTRSSGFRQACHRIVCWCWMRPMQNMSGAMTMKPDWNWCRVSGTW